MFTVQKRAGRCALCRTNTVTVRAGLLCNECLTDIDAAREPRNRRECIASAAITGLALAGDPEAVALRAIAVADALIAELDKP